jgi:hypothetical protein
MDLGEETEKTTTKGVQGAIVKIEESALAESSGLWAGHTGNMWVKGAWKEGTFVPANKKDMHYIQAWFSKKERWNKTRDGIRIGNISIYGRWVANRFYPTYPADWRVITARLSHMDVADVAPETQSYWKEHIWPKMFNDVYESFVWAIKANNKKGS